MKVLSTEGLTKLISLCKGSAKVTFKDWSGDVIFTVNIQDNTSGSATPSFIINTVEYCDSSNIFTLILPEGTYDISTNLTYNGYNPTKIKLLDAGCELYFNSSWTSVTSPIIMELGTV